MSFSVAICCVLLEKSLWRTSTCFHQPRTSMHFCPSVRMFDCRRKWVPVGWTTGRIVFSVLGPIGAKQLRLLASSALIHVYPYVYIYLSICLRGVLDDLHSSSVKKYSPPQSYQLPHLRGKIPWVSPQSCTGFFSLDYMWWNSFHPLNLMGWEYNGDEGFIGIPY